jgi:hypothetical protein
VDEKPRMTRPLKGDEHSGSAKDRRSGEDRRKADDPDFFAGGGIERRSGIEARRKRRTAAQNGNEAV